MSKHNRKSGHAPGTAIFTGKKKVDSIDIHYLKYNEQTIEQESSKSLAIKSLKVSSLDMVDWYDIRGLHDVDIIEQFGAFFNIHPLILERIVDVNQRPKYEEFTKGNFITLSALSLDPETTEIKKEHVAIYFNDGFIITFQETNSDLFESIRKRLMSSSGRIRQRGADYLAYAIIDALVDNYYIVLDGMENVIEQLEEMMFLDQNVKNKIRIHQLKKQVLLLKKSVSPLREAIGQLSKTENAFVHDINQVYIQDLYSHTIQIMDSIDSIRDTIYGLQDLFISEVSFKMNQVMQLLTLISAIFIPLTFLAGIYGMNFDNMPELHHAYGYPILIAIMVLITIILIYLFKRKKWL